MSLFGAIQIGGGTLQAMQVGLQVVGNNIANANTPGYVREDAVFVPATVQARRRFGASASASRSTASQQQLDKFVQARLVGATGCIRPTPEIQEQTYQDLENDPEFPLYPAAST